MTATTEQLLALLREARRYTKHTDDCWTHYRGEAPRGCVCGLDDVKIGIDAMMAGRVTNHPERPESSS